MIQTDTQDRLKSAVAVTFFHALIGYAFVTGLGFDVARAVEEPLKMFNVNTPLPPPIEEAVPLKEKTREKAPRVKPAPKDPEGAAAPPNIKSRPTEIVAPPREVKLEVPSPVIAAPIAGLGAAATSGNAPIRGPGTGAGGIGNGTGSGRYGDGGGGGGGGGRPTGLRLIRGGIYDTDYPRALWDAGAGGTVHLRFVVEPTGRVGRCEVTRSSGHRQLDEITCRLIKQRFRYRPSRDAWGRPVADVVTGDHLWESEVGEDRWVEADVPEDEGWD